MKKLITLLFLSSLAAHAAEHKFPDPKPSAAQKILSQEVGEWDSVVKMFFTPGKPPTEFKAMERSVMVSDGLHLQTTSTGRIGEQEFEGHGLLGYDKHTKEYVGIWVDNFNAPPQPMRGTYDEKKKQLKLEGTIRDGKGKEFKQRQITTYLGEGKKKVEAFLEIPFGKNKMDLKIMEIVSQRRK